MLSVVLNFYHCNRHVVVSHCCVIYNPLVVYGDEHIFIYLISIFIYLLDEIYTQILFLLKYIYILNVRSICILYTSPEQDFFFNFLLVYGYSFYFLILSLKKKKFFKVQCNLSFLFSLLIVFLLYFTNF